MDGYPLNLILAVATATATIFLGFLPTKNVPSAFFGREAIKAAVAWLFVAMAVPTQIVHYMFILAVFCGGSWWKFRADNALSGKMWLSLASGLGVSIGVMLILVTSRGNPAGLPQANEAMLLASIYLGGAIIGLAYVSYILTQNMSPATGITNALVQRYVGLLFLLTLARASVLLAQFFIIPASSGIKVEGSTLPETNNTFHLFGQAVTVHGSGYAQDLHIPLQIPILFGLIVVVLPTLAFLAQRATQLASKIQPTRYLVALFLIGFLAEIFARFMGL